MQKIGSIFKIVAIGAATWAMGCQRQDAFEQAISKHRGSLVDQLNPVGQGLPFYTIETLNPVWRLTAHTPIVSIPEFKLLDQDGRVRNNALFSGKITVVGFIFASCTGFCPFLIEGMKSVEKEFAALSDQVQFVAFTVNPEEDTPKRLKLYSKQRHIDTDKNWTLLTGDKETIYSLAKKTFASQAFRRQSTTPSFVHSEHLYVIDRDKNLRGILNGTRVDLRRDAKIMVSQLKVN